LTYDALLSLRGWGVDEFRLATPRFLALARWALFAEAGVKILNEAKEAAAISVPREAPPEARAAAVRLRLDGQAVVDSIRPVLFPEDDDG
jgi:hypothetical protein